VYFFDQVTPLYSQFAKVEKLRKRLDAEHDARSKELELLKQENETRQQLLRQRSEKLEQQHAELKKREDNMQLKVSWLSWGLICLLLL
jgi:seryl-tRNA synthetase